MSDLSTAPEVREATSIVNEIAAHVADNYVIATPEQYSEGGEHLKLVKGAQRKIEDLRVSITKPLNAALKAANDLFRLPAERLVQAERMIKAELGNYMAEQERIRREEQRKADEAAARERAAAEAKARKEREEAAAAAAELRRKAEAEAAAGRAAEAAKLAAKAEQREERAETRAAAFEQQAATVVAPVITREPPKVAGVRMRDVWRFEIVDPSKIAAAFLVPDETRIRKQVNALGADAAAIIGPGVRIWSEKQVASGAA